jgi:SAM-dependent methyltransferase
MLEQLRKKDPLGQVRVVQGDAAFLPFAASAFSAVLAVYLFHLVRPWRSALVESVRVLRPGGSFLLGWVQRGSACPLIEVRGRWREIVASLRGPVGWVGESRSLQIVAALEALGLKQEGEVDLAVWRSNIFPASAVEMIAERVFSDSWRVPEELHQRALEQLRQWVGRRYRDPDLPVEVESRFRVAVLRY